MSESQSPLPTDEFSTLLRKSTDDPAAIRAASTVHVADFYGNAETWVIETFRRGDGTDLVFMQRSTATGGHRLVLPFQVTRALARQREQVSASVRRRHGHKLVALRKQRGDTLGNPEALAKARQTRSAKGKGKKR